MAMLDVKREGQVRAARSWMRRWISICRAAEMNRKQGRGMKVQEREKTVHLELERETSEGRNAVA